MTKLGEFDSSKESSQFSFSMRATSNDLKRVNVYGFMSSISTDQELPYDNEKEELSSVEVFIAGILESLILTIIRESKIKRISLDEIEAKANVKVKNPLRTLKVVGIDEKPEIENIEIKIYYYIDDFSHLEGEKFIKNALENDPIFSGIQKGFNINIEALFQL